MGVRTEHLDVESIREEFPILDRTVGGDVTTPGESAEDDRPLVYLDNAATSQTPRRVVDALVDYYHGYNANVHRGIHQLSQEASVAYEAAHDRLAEFVGADGREELVFVKNTTEAMNLVAYSWGLEELGPADNVVLTEMEHHSSLVTWQQVAKRTGAEVRYVRVEDGRLDMDHAAELIDDDTGIVSALHVSNVLGTVVPLAELADVAHDHGALVFGDGAQAVPNRPVDVGDLGVDFYAFSGHKMCGPTGIGCLYGKQELLEELDPFLYGGEMVEKVTFEETTYNELPWKFEAGTPPIAEGIALAEAADYLDSIGVEQIRDHERALAEYTMERFAEYDDIEVYGPPQGEERGGVVAFNLEGVHAHDLSSILNDYGVAIRAGDHCTQPLHDRLGTAASARASFYLYNTREEVDALVEAVDAARDLFA